MKRFLTWVFRGAVALSLLVSAVTAAEWVRSYRTSSWIQAMWSDGDRIDFELRSESGGIHLAWIDAYNQPVSLTQFRLIRSQPVAAAGRPGRALWHFALYHDIAPPARYLNVEFPYWVLFLTSGIPFFLAAKKRMTRTRRLRTQCCVACGYDLRASPERCPECGAPMPPIEDGAKAQNLTPQIRGPQIRGHSSIWSNLLGEESFTPTRSANDSTHPRDGP